jgi:L-alanine-DL-glutamate epimerase-like enolase superfamily enzyme
MFFRRPPLRLRSVTPVIVRLPSTRPVKVDWITLTSAEILLVGVKDETGRVGWSEVASTPTGTGDSPSGLLVLIRQMRAALPRLAVASANLRRYVPGEQRFAARSGRVRR